VAEARVLKAVFSRHPIQNLRKVAAERSTTLGKMGARAAVPALFSGGLGAAFLALTNHPEFVDFVFNLLIGGTVGEAGVRVVKGLFDRAKVRDLQEKIAAQAGEIQTIDAKKLEVAALKNQIQGLEQSYKQQGEQLRIANWQIQTSQGYVLDRLNKRVPTLEEEVQDLKRAIITIRNLPKAKQFETATKLELDYFQTRVDALKSEIKDLGVIIATIEEKGIQGSDYIYCRHIADGGMGRTHLHYFVPGDAWVATKTLRDEFRNDPEFIERFIAEARIIQMLDHPNIAKGYDHGEDQSGNPYFTSEYVRGKDLEGIIYCGPIDKETKMPKGAPLPLSQIADIGMQILDALEYLANYEYEIEVEKDGKVVTEKRKGIIHRDLKPGNILIGTKGVKLIDFGIARQAFRTRDNKLTKTGLAHGTMPYMAIEQLATRDDLDPRVDEYAFGAILYEMFAGQTLFEGAKRDPKDMLKISVSKLIPQDLKEMLKAMLRNNREERPTIAQIRAALVNLKTLEATRIG
jgi:polyhydroxyalkanoate synthesis regulator phasin